MNGAGRYIALPSIGHTCEHVRCAHPERSCPTPDESLHRPPLTTQMRNGALYP